MNGEPREARLLHPPPVQARLVRPPAPPPPPSPPPPGRRRFGTLVGDGVRAAWRAPLVVAGIFFARAFEALAWLAPLIFVWDRVSTAYARGDLPGAIVALLSPATWILAAGLLIACLVAGAALELVVWSGGLGVLDRAVRREAPLAAVSTFASSFGPAFPRVVIVAACMLAARIAWSLFTWTLAAAAGWTILAGDGGIRFAGAAGLSLAVVVGVVGSIWLPIVAELAVARSAVLEEEPLAAIHGAAVLAIRRPIVLAGVSVVIGLGAGLAAAGTGAPVQLLVEGGPWIAGVVAASQLVASAIAAFAAVARLGAWVSAARDDAEAPVA